MRLTISASGALTEYLGATPTEIEADQVATIGEILIRLGVPPALPVAIFVNGLPGNPTDKPRDGDFLLLIPAVTGGGEGI